MTLGGQYQVESETRSSSYGTVYDAIDSSSGQRVSVHLLFPQLCSKPEYVQGLNQAVAKVAQVQHRNLASAAGVGVEGDRAFVVYQHAAGQTLRGLLVKKQEEGGAFSAKQAGHMATAIAAAAEACAKVGGHGAITLDSIIIRDDGTPVLCDLGLGIFGGALAGSYGARLSPETRDGNPPTSQADVYGIGALVYELLVGVSPEPGCRRPSEAVTGLSPLVDQFAAATMNQDASKRPTIGQLGPAIQKALGATTSAVSEQSGAVNKPARPSLAQSISNGHAEPAPRVSANHSAALQEALGETHDRWLVTKGKLDYGPFPLAAIVEQIQSNQILPGNVLVDNETGNRCKVEDHPLLSDLVDAAKQKRDDERRANAEVEHAKQERSRGAMVYVFIAAAVIGIGGGAYATVKALSSDDESKSSKKLALDEGSLEAKISFPSEAQATKKRKKHGKKKSGLGGGAAGGWDDSLNFDMAGASGGTETLSNGQVNPVIQRSGRKLGACLTRTKTSNAFIEFMIKGTGKVYQVRVNGSTNTPVAKCLRGVMFAMKFPTFDGVRSKHNFDLGF